MKQLFKYLALILFAGTANAEWSPVGIGKEDAATFIDVESKRKIGNSAEMWSVVVYLSPKEVNGKKVMSFRELDEFDCKLKMFRIISIIAYSEKLATGSVVEADYSIGDWTKIPSKSIAATQWYKACY